MNSNQRPICRESTKRTTLHRPSTTQQQCRPREENASIISNPLNALPITDFSHFTRHNLPPSLHAPDIDPSIPRTRVEKARIRAERTAILKEKLSHISQESRHLSLFRPKGFPLQDEKERRKKRKKEKIVLLPQQRQNQEQKTPTAALEAKLNSPIAFQKLLDLPVHPKKPRGEKPWTPQAYANLEKESSRPFRSRRFQAGNWYILGSQGLDLEAMPPSAMKREEVEVEVEEEEIEILGKRARRRTGKKMELDEMMYSRAARRRKG